MLKHFFIGAALLMGAQVWAETTTVEGEIIQIVPGRKEIYVEQDGLKHEFYFTDKTSFLNNTKFEDLKKGMTVKVVVNKAGERHHPQTVEIVK